MDVPKNTYFDLTSILSRFDLFGECDIANNIAWYEVGLVDATPKRVRNPTRGCTSEKDFRSIQ